MVIKYGLIVLLKRRTNASLNNSKMQLILSVLRAHSLFNTPLTLIFHGTQV
jgi:hypothetical protein